MCFLVQDDESLRRWKEQLLGSVDVSQEGIFFFLRNLVRFVAFLLSSERETNRGRTHYGVYGGMGHCFIPLL